jgi:hypothetical protein
MHKRSSLSTCRTCRVVCSTRCDILLGTTLTSTQNMWLCVVLLCLLRLNQSCMTAVSTHAFAIPESISMIRAATFVVNHAHVGGKPNINFHTYRLSHVFKGTSRTQLKSSRFCIGTGMNMFLGASVMSLTASTTAICLEGCD